MSEKSIICLQNLECSANTFNLSTNGANTYAKDCDVECPLK
ncbi:hypothetical protein T11_11182, partial [Trichinella zimbabwensis]